ncbi:MAG: class I SAM-dependent RNA methyltransferase [bacterium]|nr:class I SAM-dependent RNA methyltransferase [bacterium]
MFEYQSNDRYFAQTGKGLEELAQAELEELGANDCKKVYCGLYFGADPKTLYKINYCGRIISRVLAPLFSFTCHSDKTLYKRALELDWSEFLSVDKTFAVFANVSNSKIKHSKFAGLRLKDAIADYFSKKFGKRPNVETRDPDVWINLNIRNDKAVISLDTSGGSLHRRGYRIESVAAPIQETLAAAIVRLSGWPGDGKPKPFYDPMCGSGTLLAEAFMAYCRIPAAFKRKNFGFMHMPGYEKKKWVEVKKECDARIRECPRGLISGSDNSMEAVEVAIRNLKELPGGVRVQVRRRDFHKLRNMEEHVFVVNPPYGVRIGELDDLKVLFGEMGDFFKQHCKGSTAFILAGNKELAKSIGLRVSQRIPLYNGPLEVRLLKLELY